MTVAEFNNTALGRQFHQQMVDLYAQQDLVLRAVREATEPVAFGAYIEHDDSGFVESTDI